MEKTRRLKTFSIVALIVAVLGLTIAFAALSKTLTINGTGSVDAANWDIHFKNISEPVLTGKATTTGTPSLADNGATINDMKVSLKEPGDKVVYTVDIENSGDINAEIDSITLPEFTTAQSNILDFKAVYTSNNKEIAQGDILESKETKNVTITIMYKDITDESLLPKEGISVNLKYELRFIQTDKASGSSSQGSNSETQTYNVGDEFCLESECFYTISDNGDTVTALAKWNLNVGKNISDNCEEGIQCDEAQGFVNDAFGVVPFSENVYWLNYCTPMEDLCFNSYSEYRKSYQGEGTQEKPSKKIIDYYSKKDNYIYDNNSNLYNYVENYKTYLRNDLGKTSVTATLLSKEQAVSLGCDEDSESCESAPDWVYETSYWLGSLLEGEYEDVWFVSPVGAFDFIHDFSGYYCGNDDYFGVRPVITISKSEL